VAALAAVLRQRFFNAAENDWYCRHIANWLVRAHCGYAHLGHRESLRGAAGPVDVVKAILETVLDAAVGVLDGDSLCPVQIPQDFRLSIGL
jgi:hypothetical protein